MDGKGEEGWAGLRGSPGCTPVAESRLKFP